MITQPFGVQCKHTKHMDFLHQFLLVHQRHNQEYGPYLALYNPILDPPFLLHRQGLAHICTHLDNNNKNYKKILSMYVQRIEIIPSALATLFVGWAVVVVRAKPKRRTMQILLMMTIWMSQLYDKFDVSVGKKSYLTFQLFI